MSTIKKKGLFDVRGKSALVTGSSKGLGFAIARGLAENGAKVALNARNSAFLRKKVVGLKQKGLRVKAFPFDVTIPSQVQAGIRQINEALGPIDILVNNAGTTIRVLLKDSSVEQWRKTMEINLNSMFYVSHAVVPQMIRRKRGKIINIASLMSEATRPSTGAYSVTKSGVKMLTKSMAAEWGQYNIQANAIGPGYFKTPLTLPLQKKPTFDKWVKSRTPAGKWGNPTDLVGTAVFLASHASDYINGQTIFVDGGFLARL